MEQRLPVRFGILEFALADHGDQLMLRFDIDRNLSLFSKTDRGHRQQLLMAGNAVLVARMIHESALGFQGGHLQRCQCQPDG
jgi:hypothetical protein